jgi:LacI family transcriptional regulator
VAVVIDLEFALPWHQDCYQGIMRYGEEHGWRCSLDLHAAGMAGDLSTNPYDGVVGRIPKDVAERIVSLGRPLVNLTPHVEKNRPDQVSDLPGVYVDRKPGIRLAVEHFAQIGYRQLGAITTAGIDRVQFLALSKEACADLGLQWVEPFQFPWEYSDIVEQYAAMLRSLNQWLSALEKPVGLIVHRTTHARQVAHACIEQGLRVPQDVGIVTTTGDRIMMLSSSPTISGVEYDYYRQGYEAAAMLDRLMNGLPVNPPQKWIAPTELVIRDSTDVFLCDDPLVSEAMRYVAAHVHEELTVGAVARAVGVSRWTLHRRFEEALGRKPQQEINRLRMDYLKRLISETQTPIAEIGYRCGFSDASHLTRFFKRLSGQTPSAYRKSSSRRNLLAAKSPANE